MTINHPLDTGDPLRSYTPPDRYASSPNLRSYTQLDRCAATVNLNGSGRTASRRRRRNVSSSSSSSSGRSHSSSGSGSDRSGPASRPPRPPSTGGAPPKPNKQLPRSVRWRLSLGLLTRPTTFDNGPDKDRLLASIEDLNALKLRCQRSRYDELERRHYWRTTAAGIAAAAAQGAGGGGRAGGAPREAVAPGDDPLSAPLPAREDKVAPRRRAPGKRRDEKDRKLFASGLFGGGAKLSRSLTSAPAPSPEAEAAPRAEGDAAGDAGGGVGGSRWSEFYSTREVLDVIEKDLVRLPPNHYTIYHEWRIKKRDWKEQHDKEEEWQHQQTLKKTEREDSELDDGLENNLDVTDRSTGSNLSLSLKHSWVLGRSLNQPAAGAPDVKQSWTFGKSLRRGMKSCEDFALLDLGIDDEPERDEGQQRDEAARAEVRTSIKERAARIAQILFVYAREHREIGYRQGMHEVASYILLALEMDLLEQAITSERSSWRKLNSVAFGAPGKRAAEAGGGLAGVDAAGNLVVVRLLDPQHIVHDAFHIFECVMTALAPAYDAVLAGDDLPKEARTEREESPMETMTSTIVSKIRFVARDEQLFGLVLYMPVPPQLYFAKWVRLMFGRELAGGMKNVLRLWDAFFDLASARAASQDDVPIAVALLDVLQTAAASMILLIRHKLLAPTMAPNGTMTGEPDPNNGIGYLMNYPPLEDLNTLVGMITNLLSSEQKLSSPSQSSQEKDLSKQYVRSKSNEIPSITEHPLEMNEDHPQKPPSWPEKPAYVNDQRSNVVQKDHYDLPQVYRTGQHAPVAPLKQHVGGLLLDFGAKTASIIKKTYEEHRAAAVDHPLQTNEPLSDPKKEFVIEYRPEVANVMQLPIGEKIQMPLGGDMSECGYVDSVDGDYSEAGSVSSKSISKAVGESLQKSPTELASMLEKSVATLMKHFNDRLDVSLKEEGPTLGSSYHSGGDFSVPTIPEEIWDAMADIDCVRKELITQAALVSMSDSKSCSSFRSEGRRRRTSPRHE